MAFQLFTAGLHQAMRWTSHARSFVTRWSAVIGAFRSYIASLVNCFQCGPPLCCLPELFTSEGPDKAFYLVSKRTVDGLVPVLRDVRGLGTSESCISACSLILSFIDLPVSPIIDLTAFARNLVHYNIHSNATTSRSRRQATPREVGGVPFCTEQKEKFKTSRPLN